MSQSQLRNGTGSIENKKVGGDWRKQHNCSVVKAFIALWWMGRVIKMRRWPWISHAEAEPEGLVLHRTQAQEKKKRRAEDLAGNHPSFESET